jgi:hypothetical protein
MVFTDKNQPFIYLSMRKLWTHKSVKKEALKYKKISDWDLSSRGSFDYAKKRGLVKIYSKHMIPQFFWTYDSVKKESLKYKSSRDWSEASIGSYQFAVRNKLLKEFTAHMVNPRIIWTFESVKEEARKYSSVKEWLFYSRGSYIWASRKRLIKEFSVHMIDLRKNRVIAKNQVFKKKSKKRIKRVRLEKTRPGTYKPHWTVNAVKSDALKYSRKMQWKAASPSAYKYALINKILKDVTKHMKSSRLTQKWTKAMCLKSSKKYKKVQDWKRKEPRAYAAALKYKWCRECTKNMSSLSIPPNSWKNEKKLVNEMKKYSTRREFIAHNPSAYSSALHHSKAILDKTFPLIEYASTSLGENSTRIFLEEIFKTKFIKTRHSFLINPQTGSSLELDGYSEEYKIAFEYGNHYDLEKRLSKKAFNKVLEKDKFKKQRCKDLNIILLQITIDSLSYKSPTVHLKKQIKKELIRNKIKIPKDFDWIPLKIVQFKGKKWNEQTIWKAVKQSKNINYLQQNFGGAYGSAVQLDIIDEIRKYFKRNL